ncbi:MAG: prepilin-type N-terminal cleavage/methylation domain-containing protein [Candidatus Omnitrophota bacterium]|nr:MAG: prepilin-type N-terminal cleavage/methylation domain-containing protein [Candidatus Omnitrophota bacterium]
MTGKKSFTLVELLIVIILIGILAAVAIPMARNMIEKSRATEGVQILGVIKNAQLLYRWEYGDFGYEGPWNSMNELPDMDVSAKYFIWCPTHPEQSYAPGAVARVQRIGDPPGYGNYNLKITPEGEIYCWGGEAGACAKLGFNEE